MDERVPLRVGEIGRAVPACRLFDVVRVLPYDFDGHFI